MTMDDPLFIAILAGLIVAFFLVSLRRKSKPSEPPVESEDQ